MDSQSELNTFLDLLNPRLKLKVSWEIFNGVFALNQVLRVIIGNQDISTITVDGEGSDFVSLIVRRLLIMLTQPEKIIFYQGDKSTDIYIVAKGAALVSIKDSASQSYENFRRVVPGEHFGEIGVIYGCPRTATVTSEGYSTYAQLPKENYERLRGEIPELDVEMRSFILQMYNDDPLKQWAF